MKYIIPTLSLLTLAAASAVAQTAAVQTQATPNFSIGVDYLNVSKVPFPALEQNIDFDGFVLGAKAKIAGTVSLVVAYTDASADRISEGGGSLQLDADRFLIGLESAHVAGSGTLTFGLAYADSTLEGTLEGTILDGTSDFADNKQFILSLRYDWELAKGLNLGLGLTHFFNDFGLTNGFDEVLTVQDDDVTAPSISLSYSPVKAITLHVTYSTEDIALGLPDADSTVMVGVRANF